MNKIHFKEHQQVIIKELSSSKKKVLIAVAWLNFKLYEAIFISLALKGVKIKIIVNDDFINNRYKESINSLEEVGVKIKKIRMLSPKNYMHHKFCIIDGKKILIGSFNWSKNANSNFENLMELDDTNIINGSKAEFEYLWDLNKETIKLQKKLKCKNCSVNKCNLMILREDDQHTEYKIVSVCGCDNYKELATDHLDIRLYNSILGIIDSYSEQIENLQDHPEQIEVFNLECEYDLLEIFKSLQADYHIHGVAKLQYEVTSPDGNGEWYTKVIWKDRFAYDLEDNYYHTFDLI